MTLDRLQVKLMLESRGVTLHPELEHNGYHKLTYTQLHMLDDAEALFEVGYRHMHDIVDHPHDSLVNKKRYEHLVQAAQMGHPVAIAICLRRGVSLKDGTRTKRVYQHFIETLPVHSDMILLVSSANGHAAGVHCVVVLTQTAIAEYCGKERGNNISVNELMKSVDQGHAVGQYYLAQHYRRMYNLAKFPEMIDLYRSAALQGHVPSMEKMASLNDIGPPRDRRMAACYACLFRRYKRHTAKVVLGTEYYLLTAV